MCFCITKRRLNSPQTVADRTGCSQVEGVLNPGKSQKDAPLSKVLWWKHRRLLSCREKSLLFSLFYWENVLKNQNPALIISSLGDLEGSYFRSSDFPIPPRTDELPKSYLKISFHFVFPSLSSASVLGRGRGGMEGSPVFSGFQRSHKKAAFSSFYFS